MVYANSLLKRGLAFTNHRFFAIYALFVMGFSDTVYLHREESNYPVSWFKYFNSRVNSQLTVVSRQLDLTGKPGDSNLFF
jgi:hypothetical protein